MGTNWLAYIVVIGAVLLFLFFVFGLIRRIIEVIKNFIYIIRNIRTFADLKRGRFENGLEDVFLIKYGGLGPYEINKMRADVKKKASELPDDYDWEWKMAASNDQTRATKELEMFSIYVLFLWSVVLIVNYVIGNALFNNSFFVEYLLELIQTGVIITALVLVRFLYIQIPWATYKKYKLKKITFYEVKRTYSDGHTETYVEDRIEDAIPGDDGVFCRAEAIYPIAFLEPVGRIFFLATLVFHYYILIEQIVSFVHPSWWGLMYACNVVCLGLAIMTIVFSIVLLIRNIRFATKPILMALAAVPITALLLFVVEFFVTVLS